MPIIGARFDHRICRPWITLRAHEQLALFVVAAVALGLLLIGIHNARDSITHIVVSDSAGDKKKAD
jgi:hypothetical protein